MKMINAEIGEVKSEVSGGKIVFVYVGYDECVPNPLEDWDGIGKIYSLSTRHINSIGLEDFNNLVRPVVCPGCGHNGYDGFDVYERFGHKIYHCAYCGRFSVDCRVERDTDCIPLGYFEHGLCDWHVSGEIPPGTAGDYRWDGVRVAGVWEPDEHIVAQADYEGLEPGSLKRYRWMREQARSACDIYTKWCNGWVYWYRVEVHRARHRNGHLLNEQDDYRYDTPLAEDSCGGFFEDDHMLEEINAAIKRAKTRVKVTM